MQLAAADLQQIRMNEMKEWVGVGGGTETQERKRDKCAERERER